VTGRQSALHCTCAFFQSGNTDVPTRLNNFSAYHSKSTTRAMLSHSIKNTVLLALFILVAHVAVRNHLQSWSVGLVDAPPPATRVRAPLYDAGATVSVEKAAGAGSVSGSGMAYVMDAEIRRDDVGARAVGRANVGAGSVGGDAATHDLQELQDYVFGDDVDTIATPAPSGRATKAVQERVKADRSSAGGAGGAGGVGGAAGGAGGHMTSNSVVGSYADESTMCGGKLFDGGLQAFDGSTESAFQLLSG
jgi:hypothetical protein